MSNITRFQFKEWLNSSTWLDYISMVRKELGPDLDTSEGIAAFIRKAWEYPEDQREQILRQALNWPVHE